MHFTDEGRALFIEFHDALIAEMNDPAFPYALQGPWAKLKGYAARLALILQMVRKASCEVETEEVDEISVRGAVRLVRYFKSHARRVYKQLKPSLEDERIARAASWIKEHAGSASLRDLYTYRVAGCETRHDAESLCKDLEAAGWGTIETTTPAKGGQPSVVFHLHSRLHSKSEAYKA